MSVVRGWCPSAHRPMMSGDGLLVRVKPRLALLTAQEVGTLCDLAERYGSGLIDVTARANLQLRGVSEADHPGLLAGLIDAGLVDANSEREAVRNVVASPFWTTGSVTMHLYDAVVNVLARYDLPAKMGAALDTGPAPVLQGVSGDFRFETTETGALLLRAEGAKRGLVVSEETAAQKLADLIEWFLETGGADVGRMARHLKQEKLPDDWQQEFPARSAGRPGLGGLIGGRMFGVPFGSVDAGCLRDLMAATGASALRVTPWRMLFLEDAVPADIPGILSEWNAVLDIAACPGAPLCPQATVSTRDVARDRRGGVSLGAGVGGGNIGRRSGVGVGVGGDDAVE